MPSSKAAIVFGCAAFSAHALVGVSARPIVRADAVTGIAASVTDAPNPGDSFAPTSDNSTVPEEILVLTPEQELQFVATYLDYTNAKPVDLKRISKGYCDQSAPPHTRLCINTWFREVGCGGTGMKRVFVLSLCLPPLYSQGGACRGTGAVDI